MKRRSLLVVGLVWVTILGGGTTEAAAPSSGVQPLRQRAERGEADAQFELCKAYKHGQRVVRDYTAAAKWCLEAAVRGNAQAQNDLGVLFIEGYGVSRDDAQAVKWFRRAAEQGLVDAEYNLSVMYANGQGVRQDDAETVKWSLRAAEKGHSDAQYGLGLLYAVGAGIDQDYVRAHMWFSLATSGLVGDESMLAAEDRDLVASKMTSAQVTEAQRLAREWKPVQERTGGKR